MKRFMVAAVCLTLVAGVAYSQNLNKEQKRLEESGVVMQEVLNIPDTIPHDLLEKAECVIVFPSRNWRLESAQTTDAEPWCAGPGRNSAGLGEPQPCTRWKAGVSVSKSVEKRPT